MYSFYGGRPGNSFNIVTNFSTVAEMVAAFKQGPNYTTVHYDQHVIINTSDGTDVDNGKIYRRGYNYTNSMGGAEYVGKIAYSLNAQSAEIEDIINRWLNQHAPDIVADPTVDGTSTHAVQNKAIKEYVDNIAATIPTTLYNPYSLTIFDQSYDGSAAITVVADDTVSTDSTKPVQNKVITQYINNLIGDVDSAISAINAIIG